MIKRLTRLRTFGYEAAARVRGSRGRQEGRGERRERREGGRGGGGQGEGPGKEGMELEVYNQGMFKTELCNKWEESGECPYGEHCQFAHGIGELRPVIRHPRYKTEVCRMVLAGDACPYGHRCHFRHALSPPTASSSTLRPQLRHQPSSERKTEDGLRSVNIIQRRRAITGVRAYRTLLG
uniref:C3H1-type domain-containing protein n=1 Tax=Ananas comosus var. bracteatus TaxID=296719 RepID=A0A6V7PUF8_ANACO|nr:unnamed protein product [Ananas comosus var. bracteatus]